MVVVGAGGAGLRGRHRGPRQGLQDRHHLQVAAGQGPHGHGRGRHRRGHGQRLARGQLEGPLPRHHARRQAPEQLAHGADPRPAGAGPGAGAGGMGRAVRPHRRGADPATGLRRPPLRAAGPRGRPHRPGDDPHAAAARRGPGHRRLHGVQHPAPADERRPGERGGGLLARERRVDRVQLQGGGAGHRRLRQVLAGDVELLGVQRRRHGHGHGGGRRPHRHGESAVPPHRNGLAPQRPRHPGDRGACAATAARCSTPRANASCSTTSRSSSRPRPRTTRPRPTPGTRTRRTTAAPRTCCPGTRVARAINSEVKAGRGTEHGGVYLDIANRRDSEYIMRRLPSMYHQFKELADVDITKEAMEVGPTCHYIMGGVRVDADTSATAVPGLYAAGEVAGGLHGANRLGGNSLSDLLVFGRIAGESAAGLRPGRGGRGKGRPRRGGTAHHVDAGTLHGPRRREPLRHPHGSPAHHATTSSASSAPRARCSRRWRRSQPTRTGPSG